MTLAAGLLISILSGLYTSLWGAFKDSPYEGFKPRTFPRSVLFSLVIYLALRLLGEREDLRGIAATGRQLGDLGIIQLFFVVMGIERFITEIYKGCFRTEDQGKYFVPSRLTFFGKQVSSDFLRYAVGVVLVSITFGALFLPKTISGFPGFLITAYCTGLLVSLGGAYKDAPFEGFMPLKFQRSAMVLACSSFFFYLLGPVPLGILIFMNGGLERFLVEYYKTYIQRNMSGKFRQDLPIHQQCKDTREKFHYAALVIIAAVVGTYLFEALR